MATENTHRDIYARIYRKLKQVVPDMLTIEESGKSKVDGYMDLSLDILHKRSTRIIIALSHYYKQNGDMIPDPDMQIAVYPNLELAEALAYQDSFCYREIYSDDKGTEDIKAKKELNDFLDQWLNNLIAQGHCIKADEAADE
ncbi:MAG TPA: DUF1249 domain-containing protein [Sideroxyarcus sp.]|nr:DUF1249 domain-containing protein [Sideroxyarcus sp.]